MLFDKVVRYGAHSPNPDYEAENEPAPNAPYATVLCSRFPILDSKF
ncbi:MAG: hypothetical protein F6K26_57695 [Moorea sp. SIO2I5]|nr:hypothetical protein [Moorena sp. SIO2I5]